MNEALGHFCAHAGLPKDGEMIKLALPSEHRIRNSSFGVAVWGVCRVYEL